MVKLRDMREYELALIIKPSVSETERKKFLDTVKSWLKDVSVTSEQDWGSRALRYKIQHELTGFYYIMQLQTAGSIGAEIEKKFVNSDKLLRYLIIRKK